MVRVIIDPLQKRLHARYRRRFQDRGDLDEVRPRTGGAQEPHGAPREGSCHISKGERRKPRGLQVTSGRGNGVRSSFAESVRVVRSAADAGAQRATATYSAR